MSFRNITIASTTKAGAKRLATEANTWGQLKDALASEYGDLSKLRAVVRETRNDLESDEAVLPSEDFTLLLSPKQIKAGQSVPDIVSILKDVRDKFTESIDEIIEGIEEGDYDTASSYVATKVTPLAFDVQRDLEKLRKGEL